MNIIETTEHNGYKIGDLITTYHKGYWKLTRIKRRFISQEDIDNFSVYKNTKVGDERNALFYYIKVAFPSGKKCLSIIEKCCDEGYCRKFDLAFLKKESEKRIQLLTELQAHQPALIIERNK